MSCTRAPDLPEVEVWRQYFPQRGVPLGLQHLLLKVLPGIAIAVEDVIAKQEPRVGIDLWDLKNIA